MKVARIRRQVVADAPACRRKAALKFSFEPPHSARAHRRAAPISLSSAGPRPNCCAAPEGTQARCARVEHGNIRAQILQPQPGTVSWPRSQSGSWRE